MELISLLDRREQPRLLAPKVGEAPRPGGSGPLMILNLIMVLLTIGSIPCLAVGALEEPVLLIGVLVMFLWIEILSRDCFSE